jgi:hypothetical protein
MSVASGQQAPAVRARFRVAYSTVGFFALGRLKRARRSVVSSAARKLLCCLTLEKQIPHFVRNDGSRETRGFETACLLVAMDECPQTEQTPFGKSKRSLLMSTARAYLSFFASLRMTMYSPLVNSYRRAQGRNARASRLAQKQKPGAAQPIRARIHSPRNDQRQVLRIVLLRNVECRVRSHSLTTRAR